MADDTVAAAAQEAPKRPTPRWLLVVAPVLGVGIGGLIGARGIAPAMLARMRAAAVAEKPSKATPEAVHVIENVVLNPAGTGGTRFLMLSVAIEMRDAAAGDQISQRDAEVRDVILQLFGSKTVDQLADVTQRAALRAELQAHLAQLFPAGTIRQIYFPQYVIQ